MIVTHCCIYYAFSPIVQPRINEKEDQNHNTNIGKLSPFESNGCRKIKKIMENFWIFLLFSILHLYSFIFDELILELWTENILLFKLWMQKNEKELNLMLWIKFYSYNSYKIFKLRLCWKMEFYSFSIVDNSITKWQRTDPRKNRNWIDTLTFVYQMHMWIHENNLMLDFTVLKFSRVWYTFVRVHHWSAKLYQEEMKKQENG